MPETILSRRILALLLLAPSSFAAGAAGPWSPFPESRARLVSAWSVAPPAGDARLGVEIALEPGWHVYWKNPGDAGLPPRLQFAATSGVEGALLRFPAPSRYSLPGDLFAIGYAGEVIYPVDARLAAGSVAPSRLEATLDYLVCAASCIPRTAPLALELPRGTASEDADLAPRLAAWRDRLPRPADVAGAPSSTASLTGERTALRLELRLHGGGSLPRAPDLFFEPDARFELGRPEPAMSDDGVLFRVAVRPLDASRPLPAKLHFAWTAVGFEQAGSPVAWEGALELAPPPARARSSLALTVGLSVAFVVFLLAVARRRRSAPVS